MNHSRVVNSPAWFSSLQMSQLPALPHPILFGFLARLLHQQDNGDEYRRNRPPQAKSQHPHELRDSSALTEPGEEPPNVRRGGDPECPREHTGKPHRPPLRLTFVQFLRTKPDAKLRAAGEPAGEGNGRGA